jgi:Tol biopolymer transport system component
LSFVVGAEFSADGRQAYLKSHDPQGRASIWSVPLSGGEPRLLVNFPDPTRPSYRPVFTTDGKRIYFPIEDRQSDVHVAELVKK